MYSRILRISPDIAVIKQCARIYYNNLQYEKAREVLRKNQKPDIFITFMICETFLKEHNYKAILEEISHNSILNSLDALKMPL